MRATRNRVYGVTRIGGSNPSSSASFDSVELSALFFADEYLKPRYGYRGREEKIAKRLAILTNEESLLICDFATANKANVTNRLTEAS